MASGRPISRFQRARAHRVGYVLLCGSMLLACTPATAPATPTPLAVVATPVSLSPGGGSPSPSPSPSPAAVTASPTIDLAAQTVLVRRGSIERIISLSGLVVARTELAIRAPVASQTRRVLVTPGTSVRQGQPLVETAAVDRQQQTDEARGREQAAAARAGNAASRIQERLRQATDEVNRLSQPSTLSADLQLAQSTALQALAGLQRAEADLAALTAPPGENDVRAADLQIRSADLALQRAEAQRDRLLNGPSVVELRKAQSDVAAAENDVRKAVDALQAVQGGPDATKLRSAQRAVQAAQLALQRAQLPPPEIAEAQARVVAARNRSARERQAVRTLATQQIDAALKRQQLEVQQAEADLNAAVRALQEVSQGPDAQEVGRASSDLEVSLKVLASARERLAALQAGPSQLDIDAANANVEGAQAALEQAQARRTALTTPPPADQVATARAAVTSARAARANADERLADLSSRQRSEAEQLSRARAQVGLFQGILSGALFSPDEAAKPDADPDIVEYARAQTQLAEARGALAAGQDDAGPATLTAPSDGTVTAILTAPGEDIGPDRTAVTMVRSSDLIVQAAVEAADAQKLTVGMPARVLHGTAPGTELVASVEGVSQGSSGSTLQVSVNWLSTPSVGTPARVLAVSEHRDGVLVIPASAVRADGGRQYVMLVSGSSPQRVEVMTGLVGETDVEILSGLEENQRVLVRP